jgi:alpha-beta hydrolase superfamily lysophospholipase
VSQAVPILGVDAGPGPVTAAALVLHGGRAKSTSAVPPWSVAYLRMRPFASALRRAGGAHGLAVVSLRHLVRGWNGDLRSPVADARWALDQIRAQFGDIDVGLVGHSMGGRTALAVADDRSVRSVVALAPWIEPGDSVDPVTGKDLLIVHGTADRMTDPNRSAAFAEAARGRAARVTYVAVRGDKHAMLRRARLWHGLSAAYTVQDLLHRPPDGTVDATITNIVQAAMTGTAVLTV